MKESPKPNPLHNHLKRNGITQEEFAPRVRVSRSHLSKLMRGKRKADTTFLAEVKRETHGKVTPNVWTDWWSQLQQDGHA